MFPGDLRNRVDPVLRAPPHADRAAADFGAPLAAGPALGREEVRRMRELHDVQAIVAQLACHRGQMPQQVIEDKQVTHRVEHRDGEIELATEMEVPHVRLDDGQADPVRLRQLAGPGAHRRVEVERGGLKPASR